MKQIAAIYSKSPPSLYYYYYFFNFNFHNIRYSWVLEKRGMNPWPNPLKRSFLYLHEDWCLYIVLKKECKLKIPCNEIHRVISLPKQGGVRTLSNTQGLLVYNAYVCMLETLNQASDHYEHFEFCRTCRGTYILWSSRHCLPCNISHKLTMDRNRPCNSP